MGVESDFEDAVTICEFYADPCGGFEVDLENRHIVVDGYGIDLVVENGHLDCYLVEDPDGVSFFVEELDPFLQSVFGWKEML